MSVGRVSGVSGVSAMSGASGAGSAGRWRVAVDADQCVGTGVCAGTAPEHFRLEGGVSRPLRDLAEPDDLLLAAEETCPVSAISLRDAATGEPVPPA